MSLSPYLAFAGNCAEAIAFYQQTLGAELMFKMTFGEMPPAAQEASDGCPSGQKMADDAIAHASLRINNGELMLSDSAFGPDGITPASPSSSIPAMSLKASAGSTRWLSAGALRWPGRKPSGPTASAKSSTALASPG